MLSNLGVFEWKGLTAVCSAPLVLLTIRSNLLVSGLVKPDVQTYEQTLHSNTGTRWDQLRALAAILDHCRRPKFGILFPSKGATRVQPSELESLVSRFVKMCFVLLSSLSV